MLYQLNAKNTHNNFLGLICSEPIRLQFLTGINCGRSQALYFLGEVKNMLIKILKNKGSSFCVFLKIIHHWIFLRLKN